VLQALEEAIEAAGDKLGALDAAGLAAARVLARTIDQASWYTTDDEGRPRGLDNVTLPTFLKYLTAYGLTVEARKAAEASSTGKPPGRPAKLASVSSLMPGSG
jgi:hypothetical protein